MNNLLWVLQALMGVWYLIGGAFVIFKYPEVQGAWTTGWPGLVFIAYGVLPLLLALGVSYPKTSRNVAIGLAVLALAGCVRPT